LSDGLSDDVEKIDIRGGFSENTDAHNDIRLIAYAANLH